MVATDNMHHFSFAFEIYLPFSLEYCFNGSFNMRNEKSLFHCYKVIIMQSLNAGETYFSLNLLTVYRNVCVVL